MKINQSMQKIFELSVKPLVGTGIGRIKPLADLYQKLACVLMPEERIIEVQGFKVKVVTKGHIGDIATELLFRGIHEPASTRVFKELVKEGQCVVDIGANIGYFTLLASKLVGETGRVFCFEPDVNNYEELKSNVDLNQYKNIRASMKALSDYNGQSLFYLSSTESARHSLVNTKEHDKSTLVKVAKLDDAMSYKAIPVHFIKTDTEGNDLSVLKGATNVVKYNHNIKVLLEVYKEVLEKQGYTIVDLWDYLINDLGFKNIYCVDDYKDKIFPVTLKGLFDYLKQTGMPCNLLCSREKIEIYERNKK